MGSSDPFQRFSFETAAHILSYLDAPSIIRCEGVSRGWKYFIQAWIANFGFATNFLGQVKQYKADHRDEILRRFKELAAIEANLVSGKPTSVRKIEADHRFIVTGDFAAWRISDDIHWQRLNFRADGSVFKARRLNCEPRVQWCDKLMLNANGYLLVSRMCTRIRSQVKRVDVYCLEEQRKLYTMQGSQLEQDVTSTPVTISATQIYFASRFSLRVHDLLSGDLLHTVPLKDDPGLVTTPMTPTPHPRRSFALLQDDQRELIIILHNSRLVSVIQILDGGAGSVIQEFQVKTRRSPRVVVAPNQRDFAVVSENVAPTLELSVEKFSLGPDGLFHSSATEAIVSDFRNTGSYLFALDPFRSLVATPESRCIPAIRGLVDSTPRHSAEENSSSLAHCPPSDPRTASWRLLRPGPEREITLPPKYAHHKSRRPYVPDSNYSPKGVCFVDGDRLLLRTMSHTLGPAVYYLFDFGLRVRSGRKGGT
ncbi:hypothetical protein BJY01DRAFT_252524 [Aspergillus pseudoustus]|uniref:F-box domain-containing protein n=1 Tax=Aspergillus pseudoustus TaxID=1810923 RepID=A0ABR4J7L5_9EURO